MNLRHFIAIAILPLLLAACLEEAKQGSKQIPEFQGDTGGNGGGGNGGGGDTGTDDAVVPEGLVVDCESLASGGSLVPDSGGRSGTVAESQCIEYTFVGEPGVTYTVLLTVFSGNADLIVAFNDAYTSLVGTSANSGTEPDPVTFDSNLSARYFIAISSQLQASTFSISVRIGASVVIDITQPEATGVTPASGSVITEATPIVITFDESMDIDALELGGAMGTESDGGAWSETNVVDDTVTIGPTTTWTVGAEQSLTVDAADVSGNPLSPLSLAYTVVLDETAPLGSESPASGSTIAEDTPIVITFDETMDATSLVLGGDMEPDSDGGKWSETIVADDTLTIGPTAVWTGGAERSLTIDATDLVGNALATMSLAYTVPFTGAPSDPGVFVHPSGNDANAGTPESPMLTIQAAIVAADALYVTADVRVAAGTYNVDSSGASAIIIREGISLLGGYKPTDWSIRDPAAHETKIVDTSSAGETSTIFSDAGVTAATVIDGFFIQGSTTGSFNHGITVENSSLTITNNTIDGGSSTVADGSANGIRVLSGVGVTRISNNTIRGGQATGTCNNPSSVPVVRGIYNITSQIEVSGNIIDGGDSSCASYGILSLNAGSITTAFGNTINGGTGTGLASYGIAHNIGGTFTAYNNFIHGGNGSDATRGISILESTSGTVSNNTVNAGVPGGAGDAIAIETAVSATELTVQNNLLLGLDAGVTVDICVFDGSSVTVTYRNNDLFCTTLDSPAGFASAANGNINFDPQLVNPGGADSNIDTMEDNDWRLSISSPTQVIQGGLDLSASFSTDFDGVTRTGNGSTGWSMGAYEF